MNCWKVLIKIYARWRLLKRFFLLSNFQELALWEKSKKFYIISPAMGIDLRRLNNKKKKPPEAKNDRFRALVKK